MIILNTVEQATFHCPFESITLYPFEIQTCKFNLKVEGTDKFFTQLSALNLSVSGGSEVGKVKGQYFISDWRMEEMTDLASGDPAVGVTLTLTRKIGAIFLITYLPTVSKAEMSDSLEIQSNLLADSDEHHQPVHRLHHVTSQPDTPEHVQL